MPTSKTILGRHLSGFMLVAWPTLLAETIYPPLAHDFNYLVAGLLSGYMLVAVWGWQERSRSMRSSSQGIPGRTDSLR